MSGPYSVKNVWGRWFAGVLIGVPFVFAFILLLPVEFWQSLGIVGAGIVGMLLGLLPLGLGYLWAWTYMSRVGR